MFALTYSLTGFYAKTTISDVAKELASAAMTVARVLNGRGEISQETRESVQQESTSWVIGRVPSPESQDPADAYHRFDRSGYYEPFLPGIVRGAEDQLLKEGFAIMLCNTIRDRDRERKPWSY